VKLRDIPTAARIELLEPLSQRPSRRYLLQLATTNLQSFFNEITQTGRPWAVCSDPIILTVLPGQSEYLLPAGDEFGRVLDVTTYDPSNASFIERQVPFFELADQKFDWGGPRNQAVYTSSARHTAQRMSFFKKGFQNDTYVSVWPVPQESSSYRILYSLGSWATEMALDESPLLTQHHALLVVKTALDALPGSAWFGDEKENRLRRNELQSSLAGRMPIHMDQFRRFVKNLTQPRMTERLVYSID
jgi:hypothetical protein